MLSQDEFDFIFCNLDRDFKFCNLSPVNYDPVRLFHGPIKKPYRFQWRSMARKLFQKHIGLLINHSSKESTHAS
jgi:hypothetical protein